MFYVLCVNKKMSTIDSENIETVTSTALARNMAQTIDRVRMTGTSVFITKGTKVVAELTPPPKSGLPVDKLIHLLKSLPKLRSGDSLQFSADIKKVRAATKALDNPWE